MSANSQNHEDDKQIRLNEIHRDIAMTAATDLLTASKQRLDVNLDLPATDLMIACHALLAQREYEENTRLGLWRSMIDAIKDVIESIDCAGAKAPLADEVKLTVLPLEKALSALKACWLRLHPQHTEAEYVAAINEFERLVGF